MPWTIDQVDEHKTGLSDRDKRTWVAVANSVLKKCMDDGGDDASCAPKAIRQANGVVAANDMHIHVGGASNYTIRKEFLQGKEHIVVPIIMMVQGVHSSSHGPILHLAEELGKFPGAWDGIPVSIQHPQEDGMHVSANQPHILDEFVVGRVFNTMMDGQKLKAEAWLDPVVLKNISPEAMEYIMDGKPLEVSVGVFTDEDMQPGEWNGEKYEAVARNHRPDHLALLPGAVGACSWSDGCGVRTHQEGAKNMTIQVNAIKFGATESIPWTKPTLADFGKGSNWSTMDPANKSDIANHFLIGDDAVANYGELMFPVVNPKSGKLNEQALRAVIGGRGAQANITAAQRISARRQAYRLLNSEFDAKLEVPQNLSSMVVLSDPMILELACQGIGVVVNDLGHDELRGKIQSWLNRMDDKNKSHYLQEVYDDYFIYEVSPKYDAPKPDSVPLGPDGNNALFRVGYRVDADGVIEADQNHAPIVRRTEYVTMKMASVQINDMGYRELSQAIQTKLDRMDDDTKQYFLEDCFDGYIIYRVEPKNGVSSDGKTLFERNYTVANDGSVEFTGESQPVIKRVSYDPASQRGGMNNMADKPCCEAKVQMLIESGAYAETDRDRLLTMGEADIDVLAASAAAKAALQTKIDEMGIEMKAMKDKLATMQANETPGAVKELQALKESLGDQEKLMAILPPQTRSVIGHSLRLYEAERNQKIAHIIANTNEGVYTKERLEVMDDQDLTFLAQAIKAPVDYSGQAPTPPNNGSRGPQGYADQAVIPPDVN